MARDTLPNLFNVRGRTGIALEVGTRCSCAYGKPTEILCGSIIGAKHKSYHLKRLELLTQERQALSLNTIVKASCYNVVGNTSWLHRVVREGTDVPGDRCCTYAAVGKSHAMFLLLYNW